MKKGEQKCNFTSLFSLGLVSEYPPSEEVTHFSGPVDFHKDIDMPPKRKDGSSAKSKKGNEDQEPFEDKEHEVFK